MGKLELKYSASSGQPKQLSDKPTALLRMELMMVVLITKKLVNIPEHGTFFYILYSVLILELQICVHRMCHFVT